MSEQLKNEFKSKVEEAEQSIHDAIDLLRGGSWLDVTAVIAALHKFVEAKMEEDYSIRCHRETRDRKA